MECYRCALKRWPPDPSTFNPEWQYCPTCYPKLELNSRPPKKQILQPTQVPARKADSIRDFQCSVATTVDGENATDGPSLTSPDGRFDLVCSIFAGKAMRFDDDTVVTREDKLQAIKQVIG